MRANSLVPIFLMTVLGLASCSSSSGPTTNNAIRPPGVGSAFIYYGNEMDSLGVKIDSTAGYDTITVIATGIAYQGKNNVLQLKPHSWRSDFWSYESNG